MFGERRWLDPSDANDLELLEQVNQNGCTVTCRLFFHEEDKAEKSDAVNCPNYGRLIVDFGTDSKIHSCVKRATSCVLSLVFRCALT